MPKPTKVRFFVIAALMLMGVILYVDRYAFGIAQPYIRQELGLSKADFSYAVSSFFWFYAIGQMPAGWLSDRFGPRLLLTSYILIWSFFAATVGLAGSLVMLCLARAAFGLGQAGAFPTASAVVGRWMPAEQRGKASGFVALGGRIGGAVVPILSAGLLVAFLPDNQSYILTADQIIKPKELASDIATAIADDKVVPRYKSYIANQFASSFPVGTAYSPEVLATGLSKMIQDKDFYQKQQFDALNSLDKFATVQIEKLRQGDVLTIRDQERLNRHLLEAVFPENVQGLYVASWRPTLFLFAGLGVLGALVTWIVLRDFPGLHPRVNKQELALIIGESEDSQGEAKLPVGEILSCPSVWMSGLSQFCVNIGWLFIVTWFVEYLMEEHHVAMAERSDMIAVPLMVGFVGMLFGGVVTDKLAKRIGLRFGRAIPWTAAMILAAVCFLSCPLLADPWAITWAMAFVALSVDFSVPSMWAFTQDVGGRYVGVVLGFGNMFGNFGAAVSPILLAQVQELYGWNAMFYLCGVMFLVAGLAAIFVDASRPIKSFDYDIRKSSGG